VSKLDYLSAAKKPAEMPTPPMITIIGSPGSGKSSLGGLFPDPIFIQAESAKTVFETWHTDVQPTMMPEIPRASKDDAGNIKVSAYEVLREQIKQLATAEHEFKTLVIDSVTALSVKLEQEIMLKYNVAAVADAAGGFSKGYQVLQSMHADLIYWCELLRKRKGMAIIFLAHTGIQKIKTSPDEGGEYSVYTLDMHKASSDLYINNSDAVYYIKKETFITGQQTNKQGQVTKYGRAMQTGERILITTGDGRQGYVSAKCRYSTPAELPLKLGENPILQYIPFFNSTAVNTGE
jgi:hypothetical protein